MKTIKTILNEMMNETISELEKSVIKDILYLEEQDMLEYMENVIEYGCASGIVSSLIYYYQTEEFFKEHFEEIFELYNELKEEMNLDFNLNANDLSWFAYQVMIDRIYNEVNTILIELGD